MMNKINFNKSIRDKELKILNYYKHKSHCEKPTITVKKLTKKRIFKNTKYYNDAKEDKEDKKINVKTLKVPISEQPKPKIVISD